MIKRLEDFRFADNPKVPQATIAALAEGSWIDDRESVILLGDSGTGKTMLAIALAVCACQQGRRVRFTTLAGLANELQEAESRRELARVIARYARTELVVLDELGYLALPAGAAELVFQVISERNERASMIVTTNLPFGEWTKVFPDARLAKAVVDRLTHRAHIIDTGTESWRFRHGLQRKAERSPAMTRRRPLRSARPTGSAPLRGRRDTNASSQSEKSTTHTNNQHGWGHFKVHAGATASCRSDLTQREAEVLPLLQQGHSNAQIALGLHVGIETVRTHAHNIYRKLGVASRRELAALPTPNQDRERPGPPMRSPTRRTGASLSRPRRGHGLPYR